jgi:hypothetical protein
MNAADRVRTDTHQGFAGGDIRFIKKPFRRIAEGAFDSLMIGP